MGSAFWKFWDKGWNKDGGGHGGDCEFIEARLEEYAGGGMPDGEERARIASHLTQCPTCRATEAEYERANLAWAAFSSVASPERPGDWAAVRAKLQAAPPLPERTRRGIPFLSGRSLAVATLAVAAGFVAVVLPSPYRNGNAVAQTMDDGETPAAAVGNVKTPSVMHDGDLTVAPAFVNLTTQETFPVVATVMNNGAETDAKFTILVSDNGEQRTYRKTARLLAHQKSSVLLYPRLGTAPSYGGYLNIYSSVRGKTYSALLPINVINGSSQVGYVGKSLAALSPKYFRDRPQTQTTYYSGAYAKPEDAPDKAIGYAGLHSLVISHEGTELNAAQWNAIREWTKSGGVIFMMGGDGNPLLTTPQGAEMAPVRLTDDDTTIQDAFSPTRAEKLDLKPGAKLHENIVSTAPGLPIANVMWRPLGAGAVVYTDFNATAETLREWAHYNELWQRLTQLDNANLGQGEQLRDTARTRFALNPSENVKGGGLYDPFHLALPSLRSVVYVFLTYFVLVVPVTFVVLKHTRRLNLAWFSGPALAILFAGGIYLLTAGLYFMPTARRTSGIVTLTAGEPNGRFIGFTEFFFPRAGTYKIALPGAELLEERISDSDKSRGMTTVEDTAGVLTVPEMSVSNMAFRRIYHEQRLTLTGGVTATLKRNAGGGAIVTVENRTGETLRDALIVTSQVVIRNSLHPNWTSWETVSYVVGDVAPGAIRRGIPQNRISIGDGTNNAAGRYLQYRYDYGDSANMNMTTVLPRRPTLMARLDAAKFGPQFGKDYSGSDSVTLVVGLDESAVETPPVRAGRYAFMSGGRLQKATISANGAVVVGGTPEKDTILLSPGTLYGPGAGGYGGYPASNGAGGGYGGPAPVRAAGVTAKATAGTGGAK